MLVVTLFVPLVKSGSEAAGSFEVAFERLRPTPDQQAHVALCSLSVVKWIHLNWGDDGLLRFFAKVYKSLKPGGLFILEPQPWKSYKNNRAVSEVGLRLPANASRLLLLCCDSSCLDRVARAEAYHCRHVCGRNTGHMQGRKRLCIRWPLLRV